jgi:hypothetical protein
MGSQIHLGYGVFSTEDVQRMRMLFDATCAELDLTADDSKERRAIAAVVIQHFELGIPNLEVTRVAALNTGRSVKGDLPAGRLTPMGEAAYIGD